MKELTTVIAHEFGHGAFAIENPVLQFIWNRIGDRDLAGHDKNNPSGYRADQEEGRACKNFRKERKQLKEEQDGN